MPNRITSQDTIATGTTSATATFPGATTAGNLLIAIFCSADTNGVVVTPAGFTVATSGTAPTGASTTAYLCYKIATGSETTVTGSASLSGACSVALAEYNGWVGTPTLDGNSNNGLLSGTTLSSPNIAITSNKGIAVAGVAWSAATSAPSITGKLTIRQSNSTALFADKVVNIKDSFAVTATWTTSVGTGIAAATFKDTAQPGISGNYGNHLSVGDGMSRGEVAN